MHIVAAIILDDNKLIFLIFILLSCSCISMHFVRTFLAKQLLRYCKSKMRKVSLNVRSTTLVYTTKNLCNIINFRFLDSATQRLGSISSLRPFVILKNSIEILILSSRLHCCTLSLIWLLWLEATNFRFVHYANFPFQTLLWTEVKWLKLDFPCRRNKGYRKDVCKRGEIYHLTVDFLLTGKQGGLVLNGFSI